MKHLVWLASYPRSGNTWLRAFLTNLIHPKQAPASINELIRTPIVSSSRFLEENVCFDTDCLTQSEAYRLIPKAVRWHAQHCSNPSYHKIHDQRTNRIVPVEHTRAIVYIVRNPLDICVSFARFQGNKDMDHAIQIISDSNRRIAGETDRFPNQFPQHISSWSNHVKSWISGHKMPITIVRYEDMLNHPQSAFTQIAKTLDLPADKQSIRAALEHASFEELQRQERENGFSESPPTTDRFFHNGKPGTWLTTLTTAQINRVIEQHRDCMKQFGYLDPDDAPVF